MKVICIAIEVTRMCSLFRFENYEMINLLFWTNELLGFLNAILSKGASIPVEQMEHLSIQNYHGKACVMEHCASVPGINVLPWWDQNKSLSKWDWYQSQLCLVLYSKFLWTNCGGIPLIKYSNIYLVVDRNLAYVRITTSLVHSGESATQLCFCFS